MAGCVSIAWEIEGITDFIIEEGRTGFVCPMGDCTAFSERIAELAKDRKHLRQMSETAALDARERFSQSRLVADYARLINEVMEEPNLPGTPRSWNEFHVAAEFKGSWREAIPMPLKKIARRLLFSLGLTIRYE